MGWLFRRRKAAAVKQMHSGEVRFLDDPALDVSTTSAEPALEPA